MRVWRAGALALVPAAFLAILVAGPAEANATQLFVTVVPLETSVAAGSTASFQVVVTGDATVLPGPVDVTVAGGVWVPASCQAYEQPAPTFTTGSDCTVHGVPTVINGIPAGEAVTAPVVLVAQVTTPAALTTNGTASITVSATAPGINQVGNSPTPAPTVAVIAPVPTPTVTVTAPGTTTTATAPGIAAAAPVTVPGALPQPSADPAVSPAPLPIVHPASIAPVAAVSRSFRLLGELIAGLAGAVLLLILTVWVLRRRLRKKRREVTTDAELPHQLRDHRPHRLWPGRLHHGHAAGTGDDPTAPVTRELVP